jgi:hypothetical protein
MCAFVQCDACYSFLNDWGVLQPTSAAGQRYSYLDIRCGVCPSSMGGNSQVDGSTLPILLWVSCRRRSLVRLTAEKLRYCRTCDLPVKLVGIYELLPLCDAVPGRGSARRSTADTSGQHYFRSLLHGCSELSGAGGALE